MIPVFLIGGGWRIKGFRRTYGRFLDATRAIAGETLLLVIADEGDGRLDEQRDKHQTIFQALGLPADQIVFEVVSATTSLAHATIAAHRPRGLFVCGGLTPLYHRALTADRSWIAYLIEQGIPYGGLSAGAMIASERAILGGWQVERDGQLIAIVNKQAGEDLEQLELQNGLGLVPFAVDVHASQWGNLTRPLHAVSQGLVREGWAIDEDTMIEVRDDLVHVHGLGHAYQMLPGDAGQIEVTLHRAGAQVPLRR